MQQQVKLGYCESCGENTAHAQVLARLITRPHQWLSTRLGGGPWYCRTCNIQIWKLARPLRGTADGSEASLSLPENLTEADPTRSASVSVGNFIRGEQNLVMQNARSSRFTDKFRTSVVQRVLDGKHSLAHIAAELEIPQADIVVWMGQQFAEKQQQIEQLSQTIRTLTTTEPTELRVSETPRQARAAQETDFHSTRNADVVDGRVHRE